MTWLRSVGRLFQNVRLVMLSYPWMIRFRRPVMVW